MSPTPQSWTPPLCWQLPSGQLNAEVLRMTRPVSKTKPVIPPPDPISFPSLPCWMASPPFFQLPQLDTWLSSLISPSQLPPPRLLLPPDNQELAQTTVSSFSSNSPYPFPDIATRGTFSNVSPMIHSCELKPTEAHAFRIMPQNLWRKRGLLHKGTLTSSTAWSQYSCPKLL